MNKGLFGFPITPANQYDGVLDYGAYQLLVRRPALNPEDDHFDTQVLNSNWIPWNSPICSLDTLGGWLGIKGLSQGSPRGVVKLCPIGDWIIETELIIGGEPALAWGGTGLLLSSGPIYGTSIACTFGIGGNSGVTGRRTHVTKFTNGSYTSNFAENTSTNFHDDHSFLQIRKTGTTYKFFYSMTGKSWFFYYSTTTTTLGFTPLYFGVETLSTDWAFFNYFLRYQS